MRNMRRHDNDFFPEILQTFHQRLQTPLSLSVFRQVREHLRISKRAIFVHDFFLKAFFENNALDLDGAGLSRNGRQSLIDKTGGSCQPLENIFKTIGSIGRGCQADNKGTRQSGHDMNQTRSRNVMHFVNDDHTKLTQKETILGAFAKADNRAH